METELELMDWKDIERGAESQIRQTRKETAIAEILLHAARVEIHILGGKTNEMEDEESRAEAKRENRVIL